MRSNISVLILTFNEEANLSFALGSCREAEKTFVLDSGSTDRTRQIAESSGAEFVVHPWEGFARQKNWGLSKLPITTDWILVLDADEMITPRLWNELVQVARRTSDSDKVGYYINRYFVWEGKKIRHCGYYPSWNLRFFKRGLARYENRDVHEHMIVDGPVGYMNSEIHHEDRRGRDYIWQKHLKYAELEAREMKNSVLLRPEARGGIRPSFFGNPLERRRAIKVRVWPHLPARWAFRFVYMYCVKFGFLDGAAGLDMCLFISRYEWEVSKRFARQMKHRQSG